jgi:hypothetical protein
MEPFNRRNKYRVVVTFEKVVNSLAVIEIVGVWYT